MQNAAKLKAKWESGKVCLGTGIGLSDPAIVEALSYTLDFVWIDMEHSALTIETVSQLIMATRVGGTAALVRIPWNDPVLIKPVLDVGADGVIIPFVCTEEQAVQAVRACRYPPEGIRGFGPSRPNLYGRIGGVDYCHMANESIIVAVQIEHIEAVRNLDAILKVPGITCIVVGPNDLAGSMGYPAQPRHKEVVKVVDEIMTKAKAAGVPMGTGGGADPDVVMDFVRKGINWISVGCDWSFMISAVDQFTSLIQERIQAELEGT